jgi:hypothetical protein
METAGGKARYNSNPKGNSQKGAVPITQKKEGGLEGRLQPPRGRHNTTGNHPVKCAFDSAVTELLASSY